MVSPERRLVSKDLPRRSNTKAVVDSERAAMRTTLSHAGSRPGGLRNVNSMQDLLRLRKELDKPSSSPHGSKGKRISGRGSLDLSVGE